MIVLKPQDECIFAIQEMKKMNADNVDAKILDSLTIEVGTPDINLEMTDLVEGEL